MSVYSTKYLGIFVRIVDIRQDANNLVQFKDIEDGATISDWGISTALAGIYQGDNPNFLTDALASGPDRLVFLCAPLPGTSPLRCRPYRLVASPDGQNILVADDFEMEAIGAETGQTAPPAAGQTWHQIARDALAQAGISGDDIASFNIDTFDDPMAFIAAMRDFLPTAPPGFGPSIQLAAESLMASLQAPPPVPPQTAAQMATPPPTVAQMLEKEAEAARSNGTRPPSSATPPPRRPPMMPPQRPPRFSPLAPPVPMATQTITQAAPVPETSYMWLYVVLGILGSLALGVLVWWLWNRKPAEQQG